MKKMFLILLAMVTIVGCSKEALVDMVEKNYLTGITGSVKPISLLASSWETETIVTGSTSARIALEFTVFGKVTLKIRYPIQNITVTIPDYYLYSYQYGAGTIYAIGDPRRIEFSQNEKYGDMIDVNGVYYILVNGIRVLFPDQNEARRIFNSPSGLLVGSFTVQGNRLILKDGTVFYRKLFSL